MSDDIFMKEWLLSFPPEKRKEKRLELKRKRSEFLAALANAPRITTNNEEEETIMTDAAYNREAMAEAYTMEFYDFLTNAGAVGEKSFDRWHGSGNIWGYTLCLDFFNVDWDKLDLAGAIEEYNQIDEKDGCVKSELYDLEDPDEYDNSIRALVRLFERA